MSPPRPFSFDGSLLLVADSANNTNYLYSTTLGAKVATAVAVATTGTTRPDNQRSLSMIGQSMVRQGNS